MKKRILKIVAFVLAAIFPIAGLICVSAFTQDVYTDTYYAALGKQYDRLREVEEEKVILVGNSNVAFGADSELFEKLYKKPLVSFGLYGSLGTKFMMDISKGGINKGDIVVLALELNKDAYSLIYHPETLLKAVETRPDILFQIEFDNWQDVFGGLFPYTKTKYAYHMDNYIPVNEGVYKNSSINEYGEVEQGLRPGNIMRSGCLDEYLIDSADGITDDFYNHVNEYIAYCRMRGAEVYLSFSPVNGKAVAAQEISEDDLYDFSKALGKKLNCEVISDPTQYVMDYRYFYDTNFHLNDSGAIVRTVQLVRDLNLVAGVYEELDVTLPSPPDPIVDIIEVDKDLAYTDSNLFIYKENGADLTIVDVKDEAYALTEMVVPVMHEGKYVTKIASNALEGCVNLTSITIPVGINELSNNAFAGCVSLTEINLLETSGNNLSVYYDTFSGINAGCKIVLKNATKADFVTGYFWPQIKLQIVEG